MRAFLLIPHALPGRPHPHRVVRASPRSHITKSLRRSLYHQGGYVIEEWLRCSNGVWFMCRVLSLVAISIVTGVLVSGCASYQGSVGSIGAGVSTKKVSGKTCRSLSKALRRLEQKHEVASRKYDKLLNKYLDSDCAT